PQRTSLYAADPWSFASCTWGRTTPRPIWRRGCECPEPGCGGGFRPSAPMSAPSTSARRPSCSLPTTGRQARCCRSTPSTTWRRRRRNSSTVDGPSNWARWAHPRAPLPRSQIPAALQSLSCKSSGPTPWTPPTRTKPIPTPCTDADRPLVDGQVPGRPAGRQLTARAPWESKKAERHQRRGAGQLVEPPEPDGLMVAGHGTGDGAGKEEAGGDERRLGTH